MYKYGKMSRYELFIFYFVFNDENAFTWRMYLSMFKLKIEKVKWTEKINCTWKQEQVSC